MWSTILSWGSKAVGFALPYKIPLLIGAAVGLSAIVGLHFWGDSNRKAEIKTLTEQNAILAQATKQAVLTNKQNAIAIESCLAVNKANAIALSDQREKGREAAARVLVLEATKTHQKEDVKREAVQFKTELDCPAATSDFRQWLWDDKNRSAYGVQD